MFGSFFWWFSLIIAVVVLLTFAIYMVRKCISQRMQTRGLFHSFADWARMHLRVPAIAINRAQKGAELDRALISADELAARSTGSTDNHEFPSPVECEPLTAHGKLKLKTLMLSISIGFVAAVVTEIVLVKCDNLLLPSIKILWASGTPLFLKKPPAYPKSSEVQVDEADARQLFYLTFAGIALCVTAGFVFVVQKIPGMERLKQPIRHVTDNLYVFVMCIELCDWTLMVLFSLIHGMSTSEFGLFWEDWMKACCFILSSPLAEMFLVGEVSPVDILLSATPFVSARLYSI